jgi:hypothetical protein
MKTWNFKEEFYQRPRFCKVYEVDPTVCPKCGGPMKAIAFITDYRAIDRIIAYLPPF